MTLAIERVTEATSTDAVALLAAQLEEHGIRFSHVVVARSVGPLVDDSGRGAVLVGREDGRAVAVAALIFIPSLEHAGFVAWLDDLYVTPDSRGRGVGRELLTWACALARAEGCGAMELEVAEDHRRAEGLYARTGFQRLPRSRWVLPLGAAAPQAAER